MPFTLTPCSPSLSDMVDAFTVVSESFGSEHPYIDYVFPEHLTTAGCKIGGERFLAINDADPNTTYVKVVDSETDTVAGIAKWNVYNGVVPDEMELEGNYWETQEDKELAKEIFAAYLKPRRKAIRENAGHLVSLDIMSVHPNYQRRGVGKMLMQWGLDIADKMGVTTVVEATEQGRGLYEKGGFKVEMEYYVAELSQRFKDRPTQTFTWMVRPARH